jgi:starch synthase (maltosyl-transferring)
VDSPDILAFSKRDEASGDTVLVVCTTNPHEWREGTTALDLPALGMDWDTGLRVHDLLDGSVYDWGQFNYVRLDPNSRPAHVFAVTPH